MTLRTIQSITYHSFDEGPHLVVLGGIHGDEICGSIAINRIIAKFASNELFLKAGKLTLVPICNPQAHDMRQRYIDRNLNRELYPKSDKKHYEDYIDPILCGILSTADYLLDLHSYESPGGPFIFLGGNCKTEQDFARSLGVNHFVYGWAQAFSTHLTPSAENQKKSMGTTEFSRTYGAKAVTLECGNHANTDAPDIGERAIENALAHLHMIEAEQPTISKDQVCAKMKSVFSKQKPGHFAKAWQNFDPVDAKAVVIQYEDGTSEIAPEPGILVLPKAEPSIGSEWVYFATPGPFPCTD